MAPLAPLPSPGLAASARCAHVTRTSPETAPTRRVGGEKAGSGGSRRRALLGGFTAWSLSLTQCSTPSPKPLEATGAVPTGTGSSASSRPSPRPTGTAAVDPGMNLDAELRARTVDPHKTSFGRLYTWTTEAQLAELVAGKPLLSRAVSGKHGVSAFDDLVFADASTGNETAKLLWHEGFANKRFGWPVLYAALRGNPEPVYGNVLIDVVLKKEAWAIDYATGEVFALDGSHPTMADVTAHPERLAVVIHTAPRFREMVLVNEFMVEKFSAGATRAVNEALRKEADYLVALAGSLDDAAPDTPALYAASLIFSEPFSPVALRERAHLLDGLRGLPLPAIERAGASSFALGAARAPLAPICKVVRREGRKVGYSTFNRARETRYYAICDAGDRSPESCIGGSSTNQNEATCRPSADFGE